MKKTNVVKGILALSAILVFFLISENFQKKERATLAVDTEAFDVVDNKRKLYDRLMMRVPFFRPEYMETIQKYELMTKVDNIEIPVLEENRTFRIERIWEDNLNFAVTYSLSLLPGDDEPESIPYLAMDGMSFIAEGKQPIETGIHIQPDIKFEWSSPPPGVVYKNRIYRTVWFDNNSISSQLYDTVVHWMDDPEIESSEDAIRSINQVNFKGVELVHPKEKGEPIITQLDNITVNMQLGKTDQRLATAEINKTANLGNGIKVEFERLDSYMSHSRLYMRFLKPSPEFSEVNFNIKMDDYEMGTGMGLSENGEQYLHLSSSILMHRDEFDLQIMNGVIPSENKVEFTIEQDELRAFKTQLENGKGDAYKLERKVGTVDDSDFFIQRLVKERGGSIGFEIGIKNDKAEFQHIWFQDFTQYQKHLENIPDVYRSLQRVVPLVKVTNENGDVLMQSTNHGSSITNEMAVQYFGYDKESFLKADEIHVQLLNIPEYMIFSENTTHIKLPTTD